MSVVIIDVGTGNLFSVKKMLDNLSVKNLISCDPKEVLKAKKIIFPGVGSFKSAMKNLQQYHLIPALHEAVIHNKVPFLGICLGMQLMGTYSEEGGKTPGLGWITGVVERLPTNKNFRVPHMGWNNIQLTKESTLFKSFFGTPTFYFAHSYVLQNTNDNEVISFCDYGIMFPCAVQSGNLFGTQFHPEKSQLNGKILIENFLQWRP